MLPFLLITLHFSHIGLTEDLTFMSILLSRGLRPLDIAVVPLLPRLSGGLVRITARRDTASIIAELYSARKNFIVYFCRNFMLKFVDYYSSSSESCPKAVRLVIPALHTV